jgi:NADH:ubiquinone oxidoreductase subunit
MTIGTRLFTWWRGELVGTDGLGNRYYREKGGRKLVRGGGMPSRERRWVLYNGEVEASRVPPQWHAWLHHTVEVPPQAGAWPHYPWQKEHQPNLSGTARLSPTRLAAARRPSRSGERRLRAVDAQLKSLKKPVRHSLARHSHESVRGAA